MTVSTSSMAASSVRISNLHKSYGKVQVLKGIDMQVKPGEVVCLIGPSGSGKSTLLRCVNLLEEPNDGTIMVGDTEVTDPDVDINRVRTHMGMVFQQFNLFGHLNILDNCTIAQIKSWAVPRLRRRRLPSSSSPRLVWKARKTASRLSCPVVSSSVWLLRVRCL